MAYRIAAITQSPRASDDTPAFDARNRITTRASFVRWQRLTRIPIWCGIAYVVVCFALHYARAAGPIASPIRRSMSSMWPFWVAAAGQAALSAWSAYQTRRVRRKDVDLRGLAAVALLDAGELARASRAFDELRDDVRSHPFLHACAVIPIATSAARRGDLALALALQDEVLRSGWLVDFGPVLQCRLLRSRALLAALAGRKEESEAWRERIGSVHAVCEPGEQLLVDAVLTLRFGSAREALALLARDAEPAERSQRADTMKLVRLLHAFALSRVAGAGSEAECRRRVDSATPIVLSALTPYVVEWTELRAFVASYGLTRGVGTPGSDQRDTRGSP